MTITKKDINKINKKEAEELLLKIREKEFDIPHRNISRLLKPVIDELLEGIKCDYSEIHLKIPRYGNFVYNSAVYDNLFNAQTGTLQFFEKLVEAYSDGKYKVDFDSISLDECVFKKV